MDSKELNRRIKEICTQAGLFEGSVDYGYDAFGGKPIAYIGGFWRSVNFSRKTYLFGVLPPEGEYRWSYVGFMQSNKGGYSYVQASEEQWARIKELLVQAVKNPTRDSLEAVDMAIQALGMQERIEGLEAKGEGV